MSLADVKRRVAALEYVVSQLAEGHGIAMAPPATEDPEGFEALWQVYPRRMGGNPKQAALKAFRARVKEGTDPRALLDAAAGYAAHIRSIGRENTEFVMMASTFLGPNGRWAEFSSSSRPDPELEAILDEVSAREAGDA